MAAHGDEEDGKQRGRERKRYRLCAGTETERLPRIPLASQSIFWINQHAGLALHDLIKTGQIVSADSGGELTWTCLPKLKS